MRERLIIWLLNLLSPRHFYKPPAGYGCMAIVVLDVKDKVVSRCNRTSLNPSEDLRCMTTALEFAQAIKLRNVQITPEVFYKHVVGRPYA